MGSGFFNKPVAFGFCMCLFIIFQVSVGVYIGGILTTLEARYRLTTTVASLVLSTSDIASLISIIFVTYLGHSGHRPRIIGVLGLMIGLGGILSGLAHFLYPEYPHLVNDNPTVGDNATVAESNRALVCDATRSDEVCNQPGSRLKEAWLLLVGQALMGLAYGPLFPLAITYIDEQVRGKTTPYYISAFLASAVSSALLGFVQAFCFLRLPVNWPSPDAAFGLQKRLGAWWIAFLLDGAIMMMISIIFFFFPKKMDIDHEDEDDIIKNKKSLELNEVGGEKKALSKDEEASMHPSLKGFMITVKLVGTNLIFMACMIATISELAVGASVAFFLAKYIEIQYNLPPSSAALYVGCILMPSALTGSIMSGLIVKRLNLTGRGCGRFLLFNCTIVLCLIPCLYFLGCPQPTYAGFGNGSDSPVTSCNEDCTCSGSSYVPMCGADNLTYATPCFAGCTGTEEAFDESTKMNMTIGFTGCINNMSSCSSDAGAQEGKPEPCKTDCNKIYITSVVLVGMIMVGSMSKNPLTIMQMRAVNPAHTTFALGITALFSRALGFLPAPIYFGAAVQSACILEREECGVTSDCFVYDAQKVRLTFLSLYFALKVFSFIFYIIAAVKAHIVENARDREKERMMQTKERNGGDYNKGYVDSETKVGQAAF